MKKLLLLVLSLSLAIVLADCDSNGNNEEENNTPVLSFLSPSSSVSHMPAFTLTASGSKFTANSRIVFNGNEKETTYISSTELQCRIDPDDTNLLSKSHNLSSLQDTNVSVLVRNLSNEGGDSNSISFKISDNYTFLEPKNITNNVGWSREPDFVITENGNLYIVWTDDTTGSKDIFFSYSTDKGSTWSSPLNISQSSEESKNPRISADNSGNIYAVWSDMHTTGYEVAYFNSSNDGGATWNTAKDISLPTYAYYPDIAVDTSDNINVVWENAQTANINYIRSTDKGKTWTKKIDVYRSSDSSSKPKVVVDENGIIYAVWYITSFYSSNEIYFSRSTDNGKSWSGVVNLSNNSGSSFCPEISTGSNNRVYVTWYDSSPGNFEVLFCLSDDSGVTWGNPITLSNTNNHSFSPLLTEDILGNVNVVWNENEKGNDFSIYQIRSIDGCKSWCTPKTIYSGGASATASDNEANIYIVWSHSNEIYFTTNSR